MSLRRLLLFGLAAAVLALASLGLFFLDIDLPAQLHALRLLAKPKPTASTIITGSKPTQEQVHTRPGSGLSLEFDDGGGTKNDAMDSSVDPSEEEDNISLDFTYPLKEDDISGSSVQLTKNLETTVPNGAIVHGFSVLDNLVMHNGTFYIVTANRSAFPNKEDMVSKPPVLGEVEKDPSEEDIQFINPDQLPALLGTKAIRVPGFSWVVYDVPQFMHHYYHWWGEVMLGGWRVYSRVGTDEHGEFHPERLRMPDRFLLPIVTEGKWRDRAQIIGPFMRATFPRAAIEERDEWLDLIKLNSTILFDRTLIINRKAAHRHRWGGRWFKMIAGTQELTVADDFWSPIRKSLTLNLLGYNPTLASGSHGSVGAVLGPPEAASAKPVVTYISRQKTGRRLTAESHEGLVEALRGLEREGVCEVQMPIMESLGLREQVAMVARSTIIVGVHGNGLTHQLWMPPSEKSAVIEIVYPPSYDFDYEMLARNMGHKHFIVWNDTLITYSKGTYHQGVHFEKGFHSANIYVHGPSVAQRIKEHLLNSVDMDKDNKAGRV